MFAAVAGALVAAVALALVLSRPGGQLDVDGLAITRAKGAADVGVYVKRGARVFLWDAGAGLVAGDAIRLRIAPAGYTHLAVFHDTGSAVSLLYRTELDGRPSTLLDAAWTLDDTGERDDLIIVLSERPATTPEPTHRHWTKRLRLRAATERP